MEIRKCTICQIDLIQGVNPVLAASKNSKIAIIGQAPGNVVHKSGIPWGDKSGERLIAWLGVTKDELYNADILAVTSKLLK